MHYSFFRLFLISLVGVLASSMLQHTEGGLQWAGLAAGVLPLAAYHVILLRQRILSPTEIDSIYYFGFLVTVITLVSTAISIGISRNTIELRWVLLQFGLGLVATGYALFARLHLLSKSTAKADMDIVDSTENLAKAVAKVASEFDKAGYQVSAFVEMTERRLSEMEQRSKIKFVAVEAMFEQKLNEAAIAFNEALARSTAQSFERSARIIETATAKFAEAISSVMKEVGRVQSEAEAISFAKASERIAHFAGEMEVSITAISGKVTEASRESAKAISELTTASRKAMKLATDISGKLERLEQLESLIKAISSASESLTGISKTAADADASISSLAIKIGLAENGIREGIIAPLSTGGIAAAIASAERAIFEAGKVTSGLLLSIDQSIIPVGEKAPELLRQLESSTSGIQRGSTALAQSMAEFETSLRQSSQAIASAAGMAGATQSACADMPAAAAKLAAAISSIGDEASGLAGMLDRTRGGLEGAISSATEGLSSVEKRLSPLDDLAASARIAAQKILSAAMTTQVAKPYDPTDLAIAETSSQSRIENLGA
jgi:hypothetical protein